MISDVYKDKNLLRISPLYAIAILRFLTHLLVALSTTWMLVQITSNGKAYISKILSIFIN